MLGAEVLVFEVLGSERVKRIYTLHCTKILFLKKVTFITDLPGA